MVVSLGTCSNLGKIIQVQIKASQKETNNSDVSHTRDNSVEPPILSATIEVQDLQVPTYVALTFVPEEELIVEPKQQVFEDTQLDEVDKFDVTFPAVPCSLLSLDAMDISGEQHLDIRHDIVKKRIDAHSNVIEVRQDGIGAPKLGLCQRLCNKCWNITKEDFIRHRSSKIWKAVPLCIVDNLAREEQ
uniref:Endoplasmic reticulum vesicle transporter N-terminal domain-containing protein n=1 Tax=Fagus sylvatica TaxID=28930 RepID=A0A2N9FAT1_FAGSY